MPHKSNLLKVFNEIRLNGTVVYNLNTGETNPSDGYMVALPGRIKEVSVSSFGSESLASFVTENADLLIQDNLFLIVWKAPLLTPIYVFDIAVKIDDLEEAITKGIQRDQSSIWSNSTQDEIDLPSPQRHGTEAQGLAYSRMKAREIVSQLKKPVLTVVLEAA